MYSCAKPFVAKEITGMKQKYLIGQAKLVSTCSISYQIIPEKFKSKPRPKDFSHFAPMWRIILTENNCKVLT